MRRILFLLACLVIPITYSQAVADDADELKQVVDKAIEAAGGLENLEKAQKMKWKQEGTYYGAGAEMPFTAAYAAESSDKFKMDVVGVFTIVVNGDRGWISGGGSTQEMDEEQIKEQKEELFISSIISLVPLAKQRDKFTLSKVDGKKVEGRETVGIKVESEGHRDVRLYFDQQTHDVLKAEYKIKSAEHGFMEVDQEVIFKNFKEIEGVRMATEMLVRREGEKYVEGEMTDVEMVDEFAEGEFDEP